MRLNRHSPRKGTLSVSASAGSCHLTGLTVDISYNAMTLFMSGYAASKDGGLARFPGCASGQDDDGPNVWSSDDEEGVEDDWCAPAFTRHTHRVARIELGDYCRGRLGPRYSKQQYR